MNKEIFNSVLERHNLLQENLNNLILRKEINKNNQELSITKKKKKTI